MLNCLTLINLISMLDVDVCNMFTPGLALLAKRTEIKVKRAKNPISIPALPPTPIHYSDFAMNVVALLEIFYGAPGVYL